MFGHTGTRLCEAVSAPELRLPGLVIVEIVGAKAGCSEYLEHTIDAIAMALLDADQAFICILQ